MKIHLKTILACAALMASVPAAAFSYETSKFTALVTSGTYERNDELCHCLLSTDLTGRKIAVSFVETTYDDLYRGNQFYPSGTFGKGSVRDALFGIDVYASDYPFKPGAATSLPYAQGAHFAGDEHNGSLGMFYSDDYDSYGTFNISYLGAGSSTGPVSGSGSISQFENDSYDTNESDTYSSLAFNLISGSVRTVPEPAAWGMMIFGFGAIGATARRRRVVVYAMAS